MLRFFQITSPCGATRYYNSALAQGEHALRACTRYAAELAKGAIVTVEFTRVRIRPGGAGE